MQQDDPRGEGGIDWDAIKHAYINSGWSLARIAAKHGSSADTIRARVRKYGWIRIVPMTPLRGGHPPRLAGVPKVTRATRNEVRRRQIAERLFTVVEAKLREIEERMAIRDSDSAPQSAADRERDARSLTALARVYAKLVDLDDAAKAKGDAEAAKQASVKETGQDADRLRQDLALRLKRFDQRGGA